MNKIKILLDHEVHNRNCEDELCFEKPDPLLVAKKYNDQFISLICALFAYGKASLIVKFLSELDFDILNQSDDLITKNLNKTYYRFQNSNDVTQFFLAIKRLRNENSLEDIFVKEYKKEENVLDGINALIIELLKKSDLSSRGANFLIGNPLSKTNGIFVTKNVSPYKRWNMFLRWMVRKDNIDMGLWSHIDKKDLILPLDTHTFEVSQQLGFLKRKTYDLQSAIEITHVLRQFDPKDPIKYDFALYRIGQEKILDLFKNQS